MKRKKFLIPLAFGIAVAGGLAAYYALISSTPVTITETSQNHPPKVNLLYPKGGEKLLGMAEISWLAEDQDNDVLIITIQYTSDPLPFCPACLPQNWHNIAVGESNDGSFQWDTTKLKNGEYIIKVIASDGIETAESSSGWITIGNG